MTTILFLLINHLLKRKTKSLVTSLKVVSQNQNPGKMYVHHQGQKLNWLNYSQQINMYFDINELIKRLKM